MHYIVDSQIELQMLNRQFDGVKLIARQASLCHGNQQGAQRADDEKRSRD
jgi:hypothetical protein